MIDERASMATRGLWPLCSGTNLAGGARVDDGQGFRAARVTRRAVRLQTIKQRLSWGCCGESLGQRSETRCDLPACACGQAALPAISSLARLCITLRAAQPPES